jgi:UDP-N-acetylmuramate--alanine ligase
MDAVTNVPPPVNEPVRTYAPGSAERAALEARVKELAGERAELTMTIGGQQRMGSGDRIAVVQPHRYTRLRDLFDQFCACFNDADTVIVAPVYAAGEPPIAGIDRDGLVEGLLLRGHRDARALSGPEALAGMVREIALPGDYVVCLGAGSITQWAYALPEQLKVA